MWNPRPKIVYLYHVLNIIHLREHFIVAHDEQEACRFLAWPFQDCSILKIRAWNNQHL